MLLPAEKGGLRTVDVSQCVGQSVCCSFDFRHYFSIHTPAFEKWPIPLKVAAPTFKYQYTSDAYISELEWYINYKMCES